MCRWRGAAGRKTGSLLVSLGRLEMEVKRQDKKLQVGNKQMRPYEQIRVGGRGVDSLSR